MGTKHDNLTREEVDEFCLRAEFSEALEILTKSCGKALSDVRVLDFGCGRGTTVLKLLEQGFDAYGVDVDPEPIDNGRHVFMQSGYSPGNRLFLVSAKQRLPFDSGFFDVVMSDQVIEHVSDLEYIAHEFARITCQGGAGLHIFPAKWTVVEPHVFVPFVHWLPKNNFRRIWLRLLSYRLPKWNGHDQYTHSRRIDAFYDYLHYKTYYRSPSHIARCFQMAGMSVKYKPFQIISIRALLSVSFIKMLRFHLFHEHLLVTRA